MQSPHSSLLLAKSWLLVVVLLSFFVNLLMLTGPLYMLQVYDRVLSSRSLDTLWTLTAIMGALFVFMGLFDHLRSRILTRYGLAWSDAATTVNKQSALRIDEVREIARDGDAVARSYAHPSMLGLLDIVWIPLFLIALWFLHPYLAVATLLGLGISLILAGSAYLLNKDPEAQAVKGNQSLSGVEIGLGRDAAALEALGAWGAKREQWMDTRLDAETGTLAYQDTQSKWLTTIKTFRLFFQSAMLGLGAYLAVVGTLTPGAMIAGSILAGRALAPIDQLLSGVGLLIKGRTAKTNLKKRLKTFAKTPPVTEASFPNGTLEASMVHFQFPNQKPLMTNLTFRLERGACTAVMGESGAGKSILSRLTAGLWPPSAGAITLDGVPLTMITETQRRRTIGYAPQDPHLPDGRLMDILKGFDETISEDTILETARVLQFHTLLANLPKGYDTLVTHGGTHLPMTVRRAVLLIQAMAGDKQLLVLDDPAAGLPTPNILALRDTLKTFLETGGALILISDNLDLLTLASHILVLDQGRTMAYGEAARVVDSFVKSIQDGKPPATIPAPLIPAINRRRNQGQKP